MLQIFTPKPERTFAQSRCAPLLAGTVLTRPNNQVSKHLLAGLLPAHVLVPVQQQVHLVDHDNCGCGTTGPRAFATTAKHVVQVLRCRCRPHTAACQSLRMLGMVPLSAAPQQSTPGSRPTPGSGGDNGF